MARQHTRDSHAPLSFKVYGFCQFFRQNLRQSGQPGFARACRLVTLKFFAHLHHGQKFFTLAFETHQRRNSHRVFLRDLVGEFSQFLDVGNGFSIHIKNDVAFAQGRFGFGCGAATTQRTDEDASLVGAFQFERGHDRQVAHRQVPLFHFLVVSHGHLTRHGFQRKLFLRPLTQDRQVYFFADRCGKHQAIEKRDVFGQSGVHRHSSNSVRMSPAVRHIPRRANARRFH